MYWVGFDVGGTFIDLFAFDTETGAIHSLKQRSSRRNAGHAVREGLQMLLSEIGIAPAEVQRLAHGTTLVTNILVERAGARVGLLTTQGFRDVLEIGRMRRPSLYDLYKDKPSPLVERDRRLELRERMDAAGRVIEPLDETSVQTAIESLIRKGVEAVAVCLLHAYANSAHEERIGALLKKSGISYSLSSKVSAEYGEYERFATTVLNSYVMPMVQKYVTDLMAHTKAMGIEAPLQIMQSNGGVIPTDAAVALPVRLASSGPAAGVIGASLLARRIGRERVITLDMGGTSTDVSLVSGGEPTYISEHDLDGYPVRAVGIDIRSIGAGGGSIARLDRAGALRVGPESAGAEPGPACYGWGGTLPTVADANVVLGYLNPSRFCGGRIKLDEARARAAIREHVAGPRNVSEDEAALGILQVAITNMVGAVRNITMERGFDPRDFSLVAFGGAGPVHATFVAAELNVPEVLILPDSGLLSAKGLLLTNFRADTFRTLVTPLEEADCEQLSSLFQQLANEAAAQLPTQAGGTGPLRVTRIVELCYEGQQQVVPIELAEFPLRPEQLPLLAQRLGERFRETYGFTPRNRRPHLLHLRTFVELPVDVERLVQRPESADAARVDASGSRHVLFPGMGRRVDAPIFDRSALRPGIRMQGPAIVEEDFSTIVVGSGQTFVSEENGALMVSLAREKRHAA